MHELRLDALDTIDDDVMRLIAQHGPQLLVCCRPERQGGRFSGDEGERLSLLRRAQRSARVDVEDDVDDLSGFARERLVLSFHDFEAMGDASALVARARAIASARRGGEDRRARA